MAIERMPKEARAAQILEFVRNNPKITTKEISYEIGLAYNTVSKIVKELKETGQWPVDEKEVDPVAIPPEQRCFAYIEPGRCIALREKSEYCNTPGCSFYKTKAGYEADKLKAEERCEKRGLLYGEEYTHQE